MTTIVLWSSNSYILQVTSILLCQTQITFIHVLFFTFRILLPGMFIAVLFVLSVFTTPTSFLEILWCLEDLRLQLYFGTEKLCFFSLPFPFCLRMSPGIQMQYQQDGIFTASFSSETLPNSFSLYHNQTALVSNYYNQFQQIISMHWKPQSLSLVRPRFIPVYRDLYSWYPSACLDLLSVWDCSHVITMPSFPGML